MTGWKLDPMPSRVKEWSVTVYAGQLPRIRGALLLNQEEYADLSARLTAERDPDPETCPLDHTCDEDGGCDCWCDVHDCPAAECPSFKLVASWLRDAADAALRRAAETLLRYAENYPEDVFPADSTSRDAIGGTAMRHAYKNAADMIRNEAVAAAREETR